MSTTQRRVLATVIQVIVALLTLFAVWDSASQIRDGEDEIDPCDIAFTIALAFNLALSVSIQFPLRWAYSKILWAIGFVIGFIFFVFGVFCVLDEEKMSILDILVALLFVLPSLCQMLTAIAVFIPKTTYAWFFLPISIEDEKTEPESEQNKV